MRLIDTPRQPAVRRLLSSAGAAVTLLAAAAPLHAQSYGSGTRHSYQQNLMVWYGWQIADTQINNPQTRLASASASWHHTLSGRAYRGGTDFPEGCTCPCDYVSSRSDGPVIGLTNTDGISFYRDTGPGSYHPGGLYESSYTNAVAQFAHHRGWFVAGFGAPHHYTLAGYSSAGELTILKNQSGSRVDVLAPGPACLGACNDPHSYYVDWAIGCATASERFVCGLDAGTGDVTLHLTIGADVVTETTKKDYWTYEYLGGYTCTSETCVGTPAALSAAAVHTIVVQVYQRLPPSDPPDPVLGQLLGQRTYQGTIWTDGSNVTVGGVYSGGVVSCGPSCDIDMPLVCDCGPGGTPFTYGRYWSKSKSGEAQLEIPLEDIVPGQSHGDIALVITRTLTSGNSCSTADKDDTGGDDTDGDGG